MEIKKLNNDLTQEAVNIGAAHLTLAVGCVVGRTRTCSIRTLRSLRCSLPRLGNGSKNMWAQIVHKRTIGCVLGSDKKKCVLSWDHDGTQQSTIVSTGYCLQKADRFLFFGTRYVVWASTEIWEPERYLCTLPVTDTTEV